MLLPICPVERVGLFIPLLHERMKPFGQVPLVREIRDRQTLALQDTEPLLHLIHPRAMHWRMVELEAGMFYQPRLHLLARVHPQVVHHQVNLRDRFRNLAVQLIQEFDELFLPLPLRRGRINLPGSRVEGGKQIRTDPAKAIIDEGCSFEGSPDSLERTPCPTANDRNGSHA